MQRDGVQTLPTQQRPKHFLKTNITITCVYVCVCYTVKCVIFLPRNSLPQNAFGGRARHGRNGKFTALPNCSLPQFIRGRLGEGEKKNNEGEGDGGKWNKENVEGI